MKLLFCISLYSLGYLEEALKLNNPPRFNLCVRRLRLPLVVIMTHCFYWKMMMPTWDCQGEVMFPVKRQTEVWCLKDLACRFWKWLLNDLQQLGCWALWLPNPSLILGRRRRLSYPLIMSILTTQEYDKELLRYLLRALNF